MKQIESKIANKNPGTWRVFVSLRELAQGDWLSWRTTARFVFDGIMYGLATGVVFAWLWPASGS